MAECNCGCGQKTNLIYACSGAANTGFLADQVARGLMKDGTGSMTCLAAVGAELSGFVASARGADSNIVIDGCAVGCGAGIFERLGLPYTQFVVTDYGVKKGKTEITGEVIEEVKNAIKGALCNG
ncbi:MAG: hypothetical protein A2Y33_06585 [Spirochaetes bacterium GWF1_51_8]|nr:MAG: hypothetical protein A2Y33_06585 [Spirochaetes bacterium GWF1_51_8]